MRTSPDNWELRLLSGDLFDRHIAATSAEPSAVMPLRSPLSPWRAADLSGHDACSNQLCRTVNLCPSIHVCPDKLEFEQYTGEDACSNTRCHTTNACPSTTDCPSIHRCPTPGMRAQAAAPARRLWPPALIR